MNTLFSSEPQTVASRASAEIKRIIQDAGYAPDRIKNEGRLWFAYLPTDNRLTQATIERRFKETTLQPVGFGWERSLGHYAVFEMRKGI